MFVEEEGGGTGYSGAASDDDYRRASKQAAASKREKAGDERTSKILLDLYQALSKAVVGLQDWQSLPLPIVSIVHGSPLAACLRLLLSNDSLMDVTSRAQVYSRALSLVRALASRQDLIPLLLAPADGDVLAGFKPEAEAEHAMRARRDGKRPVDGNSEGPQPRGRNAERAADTHQDIKKAEDDKGVEKSCWKALQVSPSTCTQYASVIWLLIYNH